MPDKIKSFILTAIQYGFAVWLILLTPWFSANYFLLSIQLFGIATGVYAIYEMRKSKLNITPVPRQGAILITSGPYRYVRHPMYLALILYFFPVAVTFGNPLTLSVLFIFTVNLIFKMLFEEKLMNTGFKRYADYSKNTSRIIPLIF